MNDLNKVTARFSRAYDRNKSAKSWLEKSQRALFGAFDEALKEESLARKTVEYDECFSSNPNIEAWVKVHHPGWVWTGAYYPYHNDIPMGEIIIEEDPTLKAYTYTNPEIGVVYGRDQVNGAPSLDNDRLQDEDPELWDRISEWPEPWYHIVRSTCEYWTRHSSWSRDAIDAIVNRLMEDFHVQRVLKDLDQVSDNDLALLQEYIIPGPVSVRLRPPRKAKPEELEDENS